MNLRYLLIGLVVILIAVVFFASRPFQATTSDDPGQTSPHAIDQ
ncbi:hypothetical protein REJC140_02181 [Pseudorhizobium endolithicum]|uniref:Uncharacterized protein n=1 Tax=Pseudorhizobium endolithicum TaxID=1191678 RepID=A0ABM8PY38_9HYPH|nr:hypothetical protein [Pseudorhizobium endolithicum]CAD6424652.1 hypothetical protein REQ54_02647 [Rhizobium sp. Q54]CAD7054545.1 hypothetical protein REJC140_02181 [Pseudorhizobium endolithicum]